MLKGPLCEATLIVAIKAHSPVLVSKGTPQYVPEGTDVRQASDELLRIALEVEDQYGVTILTRAVRVKGGSG